MITAGEIRKKSERKYHEVLRALLKGEECFPLILRSDKSLSKDFSKMGAQIAEVFSDSKERKGFGYTVISEPVNMRRHGIQDIPKSITFGSLDDYLQYLNKKKEFQGLMHNYSIIKAELPQLDPWLIQNPKTIISNAGSWPDLIKVCQWFIHHFEANKYFIRELPIAVHTKFIEENKPVLKLLLDQLVPGVVVESETLFEKRYGLRYDQPLIRFRFLDKRYSQVYGYGDLTIPLDQFAQNPIDCSLVFVVENKMNFLTTPQLPRAIAVWGQGFAVELLKNIPWLVNKEIYYWSDLDVQGFQMLSRLRSNFPRTRSLLMGNDILQPHMEFVVSGTICNYEVLPNLSSEELSVYQYLAENNLRLEQERISQKVVNDTFARMFDGLLCD